MEPSLCDGFNSMTQDDKAFFRHLGARIAEFRKGAVITQM